MEMGTRYYARKRKKAWVLLGELKPGRSDIYIKSSNNHQEFPKCPTVRQKKTPEGEKWFQDGQEKA